MKPDLYSEPTITWADGQRRRDRDADIAERDRLLAVNAELVAALEGAAEQLSLAAATISCRCEGLPPERCDKITESLYDSNHVARAAIAKAKGE